MATTPCQADAPAPTPAMQLLAARLVARLCHDLSGPIGTVAAALEEATEQPDQGEDAIAVATDAARDLRGRLLLLRTAWGDSADAADAPLSAREFTAIVAPLPGRRTQLDLSRLAAAGNFSPPVARAALNVLLLAAECLPSGGTIGLAGDPGMELMATIEGPGSGAVPSWPPGLPDYLESVDGAMAELARPDAESRGLLAPLAALFLHLAGARATLLMALSPAEPPALLITLGARTP